jgi:dihydrofolate reductase
MIQHMGEGFSWLFGHRSYDDMLRHWNAVGGPMADGLNAATKYITSNDPTTELPWPNSTLLTGDVLAEVTALRARPGGNLVVMGSGQLIHSLLRRDLVDGLLLFTHPLVLGTGLRLFAEDGGMRTFDLVECSAAKGGVVVASYRRPTGT